MVAFSPLGSSAAILSQKTGRLQVVAGLPDQPRVSADMNVSDLAGGVKLMAVSDDGGALLAGSGEGRLYLALSNAPLQLVYSGADLSAATFFPQRNDAAVFDQGDGLVTILQDVSGFLSSRPIAVEASDLVGSSWLQSSINGRSLFLASSGSNRIRIIDTNPDRVRSIDLAEPPASLNPLRNRNSFLVSVDFVQPNWIFTSNGEESQTFFVPAVVGASNSSGDRTGPPRRPRPPKR